MWFGLVDARYCQLLPHWTRVGILSATGFIWEPPSYSHPICSTVHLTIHPRNDTPYMLSIFTSVRSFQTQVSSHMGGKVFEFRFNIDSLCGARTVFLLWDGWWISCGRGPQSLYSNTKGQKHQFCCIKTFSPLVQLPHHTRVLDRGINTDKFVGNVSTLLCIVEVRPAPSKNSVFDSLWPNPHLCVILDLEKWNACCLSHKVDQIQSILMLASAVFSTYFHLEAFLFLFTFL